jgi:hypothetical protein
VLAGAKNVVEGEVRIGGQEHFYLETHASLVVPGENDEFTVYASTQNPTKTSNFVAAALGVPKNKVTSIMMPKPETLNLKPETLNLKPETPNLKPETRNPQPHAGGV